MTPRPQLKISVFIRTALEMSRLSTCLRARVGAVLLRQDGSVAGTGYNGSLPGYPHCTPEECNESQRCYWTRHAERSALDYSDGPVHRAFVTHEPCLACLKDLLARGCREVYYLRPYAPKDEAEKEARAKLLEQSAVSWQCVTTMGERVLFGKNRRCSECSGLEWTVFRCVVTGRQSQELDSFNSDCDCEECKVCVCAHEHASFGGHLPDRFDYAYTS